ncbi:MAG: PAS-domain containing protein, partial [Pseudomonadota bacterium]
MSVCEVDASQTSLPAAPAVRFGLDEVELLLEGTEAGLALFDPDWRLVFANPRYATLCGYALDELRPGATLQDLMRISLRRSDAFEDSIESHVARGVERLKASGGYSFQHRAASGVQLSIHRRLTADGQVVDTVKPATESADYGAAAQLAQVADAARARLSHALDAMADGFALFDADDRLVAYNAQYIGFNPHIADVIAPGRSFEEMLREGMTRSGYEIGPMSAEEFVAWRLEQHRNPGDPYDLQMTDGRWVRVHEKRTSDGGIVGIRS